MKNRTQTDEGLLRGYRALDLTDETGLLCGRLLADLGVDVVKVERPGGDKSRRIGPFYKGRKDPEKSLYWFSFNANKRGITLDITKDEGREIFTSLAAGFDIVIESFPVGYMKSIGLDYDALYRINSGIIMAAITPFGQTGPYAGFLGTDLTVCALSGYMSLCGDPDRPPVRIGFPQAFFHAGAFAAGAIVTALIYRGVHGKGQFIDVSAQASLFESAMDAPACWTAEGKNTPRMGGNRIRPGTDYVAPAVFECRNGYIYFVLYGKTVGERANRALVEWMEEENAADEFLRTVDWKTFDPWDACVDQVYIDRLLSQIAGFFKKYTKRELFEEGLRRHIMLFALGTPADIAESLQLDKRGYWIDLHHPEIGNSIRYPGAFVALNQNPCTLRSPAPRPGEHNKAVYSEILGFSETQIVELAQRGVI